jgi:cytochrome d ubiquinol oxidase subunit II
VIVLASNAVNLARVQFATTTLYHWFLWAGVFTSFLPFVATSAGWILTEVGRQPWIVQGLLKTSALAVVFAFWRRSVGAFAMTAIGTVLTVATLFTSLYPRVIVSSTDFANSLTVDNASSADYTLKVMTVIAVIFLPIVLLYQCWSYHVFRHRIDGDELIPGSTPPAAPTALTGG